MIVINKVLLQYSTLHLVLMFFQNTMHHCEINVYYCWLNCVITFFVSVVQRVNIGLNWPEQWKKLWYVAILRARIWTGLKCLKSSYSKTFLQTCFFTKPGVIYEYKIINFSVVYFILAKFKQPCTVNKTAKIDTSQLFVCEHALFIYKWLSYTKK